MNWLGYDPVHTPKALVQLYIAYRLGFSTRYTKIGFLQNYHGMAERNGKERGAERLHDVLL